MCQLSNKWKNRTESKCREERFEFLHTLLKVGLFPWTNSHPLFCGTSDRTLIINFRSLRNPATYISVYPTLATRAAGTAATTKVAWVYTIEYYYLVCVFRLPLGGVKNCCEHVLAQELNLFHSQWPISKVSTKILIFRILTQDLAFDRLAPKK